MKHGVTYIVIFWLQVSIICRHNGLWPSKACPWCGQTQ